MAGEWSRIMDNREIFFSDPQMNALREAALRGDWAAVFAIRPRGAQTTRGVGIENGPEGIAADMPGVAPGSPQAIAAWNFWLRDNPLRKQISLNELMLTKDASGKIIQQKPTREMIENFYHNFVMRRNGYDCGPGQIQKYINDRVAGRPILPLSVCAATSSSRRRKAIKKAAAVAAGAVTVAYLGPIVYGKVAPIVKAGVGTVTSSAGKLVDAVNARNTIKAIKDGEIPPPPISVADSSFSDWAVALGKDKAAEYVQGKMTAKDEAALRAEIEAMQREMTQYVSPNTPARPSGNVSPEVQAAMLKKKTETAGLEKLLAIAIPVALLFAVS